MIKTNELTVITKWISDKDGNRPYFPKANFDGEDITCTPATNLPAGYVVWRVRCDDAALAVFETDPNIKIVSRKTTSRETQESPDVIDYEDAAEKLASAQVTAIKALFPAAPVDNKTTRTDLVQALITTGKALPKIEVKEVVEVVAEK